MGIVRVVRALLALGVAVVLAVALFLAGGLSPLRSPALDPGQTAAPQGRGGSAGIGAAEVPSREGTASSIASLQTRLRRLPSDWSAWASLGAAYLQQARLTADPTYYAKAEGAFDKSLELRPKDNADALTGQAALAAARHDFAEALRLTSRAKKVNPYSAANAGVRADALIELGRYDQAEAELQRMVDLKPGVPSFSRISYARELRGDVAGAREAMQRALDVAYHPADAAFAAYHLGQLAFDDGDLDTAAARFDEGLQRDASFLPLLAGRARVAAARGQTDAALRDYEAAVRQLPEPTLVAEYGDLLTSLGRHDEARRQYDVVAASTQIAKAEGANVDLELSLYDADHGRPQQALEAAEAEVKRRSSVHVEDAYAWALHVNGRDREALGHAEAAARLGTRSALFAYHRGMIELALGDRDAARASLTRALDINPHFSVLHAPKARQALAELGSGS